MSGRVLLFGTFDERVHPRTRVIREGLVARGVEVETSNVELGFSTAERVRMLDDPRRLVALVGRLLVAWTGLVADRARRRLPVDAVLVGYLGHFDVVLARLLHPRTTIMLDYLVSAADTALDRRRDGRVLLAVLRALDLVACACADVVLVDTDDNVALVPVRHRHKARVVRVGAAEHWFHVPDQRIPGPLRGVFFGLFTPLQGAPVLAEALAILARRGTPFDVVMIGDGQDRDEARRRAPGGVEWLDWVEPDRLPAIVADHDVCFGIFGATPKGARVVPNKAYQGAAAGALVVTSDTPPQRSSLPSSTVFVPPGDPVALASALRGLSADDALLERRRASQAEAVELFSPAAVVEPILTELGRRSTRGAVDGHGGREDLTH